MEAGTGEKSPVPDFNETSAYFVFSYFFIIT